MKDILNRMYYNNGNHLSLEEIKIVFSGDEKITVTVDELLAIKQALSDKDYEIHRMKIENGISITEWGMANQQLQSKLNAIEEVVKEFQTTKSKDMCQSLLDMYHKLEQILKGESK